MASFQTTIHKKCTIQQFDSYIEKNVIDSSMSASLEESTDMVDGDSKCCVRVFERFSYTGGNRLSLNVTCFQCGDGPICVFAAATGGSQALLFKINTWGEESFLSIFEEIVGSF